jgi:hypothetical protein
MKATTKPKAKKGKTPTKKAEKLQPKHERFAELVAAGMPDTEAYIQSGCGKTEASALKNAWRVRDIEGVKAKIAELTAPKSAELERTKKENLQWLTDCIVTPISAIGPDSPLCVEYVEEFVAGGSRGKLKRGQADSGNEVAGPDIIRRRVKKADPLRAMELFARMRGHFEPDRVEVEAGPKTLMTIKERAAQVSSALALRYQRK